MRDSRRFGRFLTAALPALLVALTLLPRTAFALKAGDPFPHFTGKDLDGATVDSRALGNKKVLLIDFWSVYCSSCIQEMPHIVALYEKYKDKGLQPIGIDMDPMMPPAKVKKFLAGQNFKMSYVNVHDTKREVMGKLGVSVLPTTILVDTTGVVRLFHIGYKPGFEKELEEQIKKLLPQK